jgi:signal transduction histidine kinase/CheY-like chemotaxis protein
MAFLVPAIAFLAVVTTVAIWEGSRSAEVATLQRARDIVARADAEIEHEMRSIAAVATTLTGVPITQSRPAPGRAQMNEVLFPQWIGSMVWLADERRTVFSAMPFEALPDIPPEWAAQVGASTEPVVGGIDRIEGAPAVVLHQRVPDDPRGLVLTIALRPEAFRDMLMAEIPEKSTGAIVDRHGNFIARSLDHANRVGTPATVYVRDAVKKGGEGLYRGRTYEGVENVSVYHTSKLTGWSAHLAISNTLIDAPASLAVMVAIAGGVLSLAFAGALIWLVTRDTQRRQQTELALAQAQRVESLGRLTGGIAHDFNNMLTVIIGSLERARKLPEPAQSKAIDAALSSARQAAGLTRSLLLYSRQQPLSAQVVNINDCVRETAEVVQRTLGANYDIALALDPEAGAVSVDPAQMASALINLTLNARDAMPDGGTVTLGTARRSHRGNADAGNLEAGEQAEVFVTDTGAGMPPEIAQRAFEPFFSTKDVGKGTGLGLSQVDGFVRQSGGVAEIRTSPGAGTTVTLRFRRVADAAVADDTTEATAMSTRPLRVLLVEDNAALLEHAVGLLRDAGHEVAAFTDAATALPALQRDQYDLLFSDIVLPGAMSGVDLAARAREIQPGIAIVLATGYARDELEGKEDAYKVILKPYSATDVARAIDEAVTSRPNARRVLIVEDELFIRMTAAEMLADAGQYVVEAGTISDALNEIATASAPFDCAIIDIGLPDGSGLDLAMTLHERQPGLRIVISTGGEAVLPDWALSLPKPYSPEALVAIVCGS